MSEAQGIRAAERAMLGIFASLVREIGSSDRIGGWVHLFGMVCDEPSFTDCPKVIDGASRLVSLVFGPVAGQHSRVASGEWRVAIGVAGLPFNGPVEVQAERDGFSWAWIVNKVVRSLEDCQHCR